jgi:hypothetical protein
MSAGLALSRRRLLQAGSLGWFRLQLPAWLQALGSPTHAAPRSETKACILVFLYGGPSHLETFDMKPHAPAEVRGEFSSIQTSVPGLAICEHLPRMARVMHRVALVRSLHHPMRNHNAAAVEALCGRTPLGGDQELLADDAQAFPCYGSALHYLMRERPLDLHSVALPHVMYNVVKLPGQIAGFLGPQFNPFHVQGDPTQENFRIGELELPAGMDLARLEHRQSLMQLIDGQLTQLEGAAAASPMMAYYDKAMRLLQSPQVRHAFDISQEDGATRDRYGRHVLGQSLVLARRLVESGVPFVTVYDKVHNGQEANWDCHSDCFVRHRDDLLPPTDEALSGLIEDLAARGLLESTLVLVLGEFGRSPKINGQVGRDHWPDCFTVMLAGGGIKGGSIYGGSDKWGAYPEFDPVTPGDLAATLYWRFGFDPHTEVRDLNDRPFKLAEGTPLTPLFA